MTQLSSYQKAILQEAAQGINLAINARAGTGKSWILEQISKQTTQLCLVLAFNKHNAVEIDGKIRGDCKTIHSLGMGILTRFAPTKVNRNKIIPLARLFKIPVKKRLEFETFWNVYRLSAAHPNSDHWKEIVQDFCDFNVDLYYEQAEALEEANMSLWLNDGIIDFIDMLWIPARLPNISPVKYDLVAMDECFPGKTKIITSTGKRKIKAIYNDIQKGKSVMVKSLNEHTNEFEWKPVTKAWNRGTKDIYEVVIGGKTRLKATLNHPILTSTGWKHLGELVKGDAVITSDTTEPSSRFIKGDLEDLMLGTSLGDGHIHRVSQNKVRLTIGTHGMPQYEYCKWKADAFQAEVVLIEKNGFSQKPACRATTKTFYCEYPDDLSRIEALTLKSLAVLYMDDGSLSSYDAINLYACAPDKYLTEAIQRQIYKLTREAGAVKTLQSSSTGNDYHLISYTKESSRKILELIAPFIHHTMKYKLPSDLQHIAGSYHWDFTYPLLGCRVVNSAPTYHSTQDAYDLEVADNHNFLVGSTTSNGRKTWDGIVVHNCQDASPIALDLLTAITTSSTQIIVALDPEQKIYTSLNILHYENLAEAKRRWGCKELALPVSYRCPSNVVDEANIYVPDMQYAKQGGNVRIARELPNNIPRGSLVLSLHYANLMPQFIERRLAGEKVALRGHNFIEECIKVAKKSDKNPHNRSFSYLVQGAQEVLAHKIKRCTFTIAGMDEKKRLESVSSTLEEMDTQFSSLQEAEEFAGGVTKLAGADYIFSSIHRCKGGESDNVYFLGYNEYSRKSLEGDVDTKRGTYVGLTRSKENLVLVS